MKLLTCLAAAALAWVAVTYHVVGPYWAGVPAPNPAVGSATWMAAAFTAATVWVFLAPRIGLDSLVMNAVIGVLLALVAIAFKVGAHQSGFGHDIAATFVIAAIAVFVMTVLARMFGNERPAHGH